MRCPPKRARPETEPSAKPPGEAFVAVGRVRRPRGVRGELSVDSLTDFPERFQPGATLWAGGSPHTIRGARKHHEAILLELDGIDTREQAEAWRGVTLEVPETALRQLDEGRYYRHQVIGIEVVDGEGHALGRVEEILETGANDVYVVRTEDQELLVPAIDSVVREVDVAGGRMVIEVLPGMERRPIGRAANARRAPARPSRRRT